MLADFDVVHFREVSATTPIATPKPFDPNMYSTPLSFHFLFVLMGAM